MTLEDMLLAGDTNKVPLKKSVTEAHCNRLLNHWTSKIYQIFKFSSVSLMMIGFPETLRGRERENV